MVDKITVPTYEKIETILSKLATNYSNIALSFYDIFYNTTPMEVTLQMYDEAGVLRTYTIPNRAMDMQNILSGEGSPNGNEDYANFSKGSLYQDLQNGELYIKRTPEGVDEGWDPFINQEDLDELISVGVGKPENVVTATRGSLYVDKSNSQLYIKTTDVGNTGWTLISADTDNLAKTDLSNLTEEGNNYFMNKSLSNMDATAQALFDAKQNIEDRVTIVNSESTNEKYPTAKAVYSAIETQAESIINNKITSYEGSPEEEVSAERGTLCSDIENDDLYIKGQLQESAGENKGWIQFLKGTQIKGCLLAAPRGLMYYNPDFNSVIIPYGSVILAANGFTTNRQLNNKVVTITTDNLESGIPLGNNKKGRIFYDSEKNVLRCLFEEEIFESAEEPSTLFAWKNGDNVIYTKDSEITENTKLYKEDFTEYKGSSFKVVLSGSTYVIEYNELATTYDSSLDKLIVDGSVWFNDVENTYHLYSLGPVRNYTVVGSPTITNDGIASNFSANNNVTGSFTPVTPQSTIIFRMEGVYSSTPNTANGAKVLGKFLGENSSPSIECASNSIKACRWHNNGSTDNTSASVSVELQEGDVMEAEVRATSTSVTLNVKVNGVSYTNTWSGNGLFCGTINGFQATYSGDWFWTGPINLKAAEIIVDGEQVYKAFTNSWLVHPMAELGRFETDDSGYLSAFKPYEPITLVAEEDYNRKIAHVVVEVGGTEENWYRLYQDGWIEMGGYLTGGGTVNLLKEFASTHYTLVPSANATSFTKGVNSFTLTVSSGSRETDWVAYGWSA